MRRNLIVGSIMVVLLFLGIWLGYSVKQPTKQIQVQLAKKAKEAKSAHKPKPKAPVPAAAPTQALVVPPMPPAPAPSVSAPAPASVPSTPPRSIRVLSGNSLSINILSSGVGGGWMSGVRVNGYGWNGSMTRWVPGYARRVCEDRSAGRVCYDTWEPAHYE